MDGYQQRVLDSELDVLLPHLAAIAIEGPKGVGKTATAQRRAATIFRMDAANDLEVIRASPSLITTAASPVLIDEWQRYPQIWDFVRRAVDDEPRGGRFLLTGSATPQGAAIHSGAGRIDSLRMRPLSFFERQLEAPSVSLLSLFDGHAAIAGRTTIGLSDYVQEIVSSGFPGIRPLPPRARRHRLDGYIQRVIEHEVVDQGVLGRQPTQLRAWITAYAAATASTASYTTIGRAASPGEGGGPARSTVERYRDALSQLWLLDPVPAWLPGSDFARLALTPKHFLADPALSARLLGLDETRLLAGARAEMLGPQGMTALGALFEGLVALSLQTLAQAVEATVHHIRTRNGDREVDFLLHRNDGTNVAIEVKLSDAPNDRDVRHLLWLKQQMGDRLSDLVVLHTGTYAYRRQDGVAVVPLALLGP